MLPVHKYVLLRTNPPSKLTKGGVHLVNEKPDTTAVIVEIGPDAFEGWYNPPKLGDRVLHFGAIAVGDDPDGGGYYLALDEKLALITDIPKISLLNI